VSGPDVRDLFQVYDVVYTQPGFLLLLTKRDKVMRYVLAFVSGILGIWIVLDAQHWARPQVNVPQGGISRRCGTGCGNSQIAGNVYFDSVAGSDNNNCLTTGTACASVAKMASLLYAGGATINWKANSAFTGCFSLSAANVRNSSPTNPITIQAYGSGSTPMLTSNCGAANSGSNGPKTAALTLDSVNVTVNGIALRGSGLTSGSATQYGIAAQNSSGIGTPNFIIENVDISGFGASGATGDAGAEIFATGYSQAAGFPNTCGNITVSILNTTLHGASTTAADDNGFSGSGCNPNGFVSWSVQGNLAYDMGGHTGGGGGCCGSGGAFSSYNSGSYVQFSLAHDNGGNVTTCGGPAGFWAVNGTGGIIQFDEVYNMQNTSSPGGGCDWAGYDWDIGTNSSIGQYLYSHHNGGPGFLMFNTNGNNVFRYSVSENDANYNEDGGGAVALVNPGGAWAIYNITVFLNQSTSNSSPPACVSIGGSGTYTGGLWANSACSNSSLDMYGRTYMISGTNGTLGENSVNMVNNDYYNAGSGILTFVAGWNGNNNYSTLSAFNMATGQEANSIATSSGFASPPSGNCTWTPSSTSSWPPSGCSSAYSTIASGLTGTGANLVSSYPAYFTSPFPTTVGTRDYYGNSLSSSYNMGAFQ
jgi:hypothetical protein